MLRQRGQAAIITVLLMLGAGTAVLVYTLATPSRLSIESDKKTAAALAQAREALIGYAASDNRPGSLPCPDIINNGSAGTPIPTDCPGYITGSNVYVGRLPWRTLGLPDLRDGSGERLWYAVSREYALNPSTCGSCPLNSETPGQLSISGGASGIIAIVFSAGTVSKESQVRDTVNENSVANYLEGGNENGNATATFFINADDSFNDKLMPITRDALFPVVEIRVARELRSSLQNYYSDNNYYPFAAPFPGFTATTDIYQGHAPTAATPSCAPPTPDLSPYLPSWFSANNWQQFMVYAVASRCTARILPGNTVLIAITDPDPPCTSGLCISLVPLGLPLKICFLSQAVDVTALGCNKSGGSWLTVGGVGGIRSIVLPASYRLPTPPQTRPCNTIADCLETVGSNIENVDNDAVYVKPVRSPTNNDNLIIVDP